MTDTPPPARRLYIKTYGCQMNVYDSERMAEAMGAEGYVTTEVIEEADMVLLNTCHIREKASEKLYSDLGRLRPLKAAKPAQAAAVAVLERSCRDCHSNDTTWPWYSHVAPVSWLVARDVNEGRGEFNMSEFGTWDPKKQQHKLEEACTQVKEGEMPMWIYVIQHADAKLQPGDVELIKQTLWNTKSPVLINYNDTNYWHVITIIGYDDSIQDASCYETLPEDGAKNQEGAFYIRDSFGVPTELRDTDWFRVKGNAAFSVMLAE